MNSKKKVVNQFCMSRSVGATILFLIVAIILYRKQSNTNNSLSFIDMENVYPDISIKKELIRTHLGDISIKIISNNNNNNNHEIPIVCLPGINSALVDEWLTIIAPLVNIGYRGYIINFHSNPKTTPSLFWGGISDEDVSKIISEYVLEKYLNTNRIYLMGKSWGGKQAMIFTTTYPNLVNKLFLIAPASSDKTMLTLLQKSNKDIFLGWAEDDYTVWYSNTKIWKEIFKSSTKLHLYSAIEGGHKILLEYLSPIIRVLQEEK